MKQTVLAGLALAAFIVTACGSNSPTTPAISVQSLQGVWTSSSTTTGQNVCTNFKWTVTSLTSNSGSGTFSATCLGSLDVAGVASGTLSGSTLAWAASGTATPNGGQPCQFSLTGTATLENNNQVRVPYSGTICGTSVSGVETLKK